MKALTPEQMAAFIGREFGRLTVLSLHSRITYPCGAKGTKWNCHCVCGAETKVTRANLIGGHSASCGCLHRDKQTKHGKHRTPEYRIWIGMMSRCSDGNRPEYKHYGGRGIRVCERWHDVEAFLGDMGPRPSSRHSVDRIDPNGDYRPENCRWSTTLEQGRNRRMLSTNTSGHTGVVWRKDIQKWCAQIGVENTMVSIGFYSDKEEAIAARRAKEAELGFSPNHGKARHADV